MHYQKLPLTTPQQIIKLKERDLLLGDETTFFWSALTLTIFYNSIFLIGNYDLY